MRKVITALTASIVLSAVSVAATAESATTAAFENGINASNKIIEQWAEMDYKLWSENITMSFDDVSTENGRLTEAVYFMTSNGVMDEESEGLFGTDEIVTREEMTGYIYSILKNGEERKDTLNLSTFEDLADSEYSFMISWANSNGIVKGTSQVTFEPKASITLRDAYTMIVRAVSLGDEELKSIVYPFGFIDIAENLGLSDGIENPTEYTADITKGEAAILLYNAFLADVY